MTDFPPPGGAEPDRPTVIDEDRAKQGRRGVPVFIVLVVSAALAAFALFALWMGRSGDLASTEPHNARQASDAAGVDQPTDTVREEATPEETGR